MPTVMTVDDSRAVRSIVTKQLKTMGFEVDEAEDGQQALDKLEELTCDLILLDVTMPVMDGPTMLGKLRERGDKTPVLMLTSESKRSIVAEAMRLGIEDYILKPFKPEELAAKVRAALKLDAGAAPAAAMPAPASREVAAAPAEVSAGKQFIDVMLVDDMENVGKRLKTMLPPHVTINAFTSAQAALTAAKDRVFRVMVVDTSIPDVDSAVLAGQLRILQPQAAMVALALKTTNDVSAEFKSQGFQDVLFKPFTPESIEDFVLQYFDKQDLLVCEDNLLKVGAFVGRRERLERYFTRLGALLPPALEKVAAACYEDAIVDLSKASVVPDRLPRLMVHVAEKAKAFGLQLRLVGSAEVGKALAGFQETRDMPIFPSVQEARAEAA